MSRLAAALAIGLHNDGGYQMSELERPEGAGGLPNAGMSPHSSIGTTQKSG